MLEPEAFEHLHNLVPGLKHKMFQHPLGALRKYIGQVMSLDFVFLVI